MDSNKLFMICHDDHKCNTFVCCGIYTDLESAKSNLKNIYKNIPDYKYYNYKIQVYNLIENEYILTNKIYTYKFDKFLEFTI